MPEAESIGRLVGWEGYRAGTVQRFEAGVKGPRPQVWIELHPDPRRTKVCDRCGQECPSAGDLPPFSVPGPMRAGASYRPSPRSRTRRPPGARGG